MLAWGLSTLVVFHLLGTVVGGYNERSRRPSGSLEVDREAVVNALMARTDMSHKQARRTVGEG